MRLLFAALCALFAQMAVAQETVGSEKGLAAWDEIYAVAAHPRCTNCHVGEKGRPGWAALGYGETARHGMAVHADASRIGAESIPCRTCHVTSGAPNVVKHAAPHVGDAWRLPPVELAWISKSSADLCMQLRNPETNDGSTIADLIEHVRTSPFVAWGFAPGVGRIAAPGDVTQLAQYLKVWGGAGSPCVGDP